MRFASEPLELRDSCQADRLLITASACSLQGTTRNTNEDRQYVSPNADLFIVADGIAGNSAGELASLFAVEVLSHELSKAVTEIDPTEIEHQLHAALEQANCLILDYAAQYPESHGASTTVVLALLADHHLYVTGVGDSRAYLVRGNSIERLTVDDTWPDQMLFLGKITTEEARKHHMRNVLFNALGMKTFEADKEEIRVLDVYHGDRYLLASDGLTDNVGEDRILEIMGQVDEPQQAVDLLAQEALANEGHDDITIVVFFVQSNTSDGIAS